MREIQSDELEVLNIYMLSVTQNSLNFANSFVDSFRVTFATDSYRSVCSRLTFGTNNRPKRISQKMRKTDIQYEKYQICGQIPKSYVEAKSAA